MDRPAIKELVREVLGPNIVLVDHPEWVGMHCPLARWTHAGGSDSKPSAGISVKEDETSVFHCWSCGSKGKVSWLLAELEKYTGDSWAKLAKSIEDGEYLGGTLPEWGSKKVAKKEFKFLDKAVYLDLYDTAVGHPYLTERQISEEATEIMGLLHDPADSMGDERILFPVYSRGGDLFGFTGRAVWGSVDPKVRDYHGLPKRSVLLGAHLIQEDDPYVIVVEGLFDYATMVENDMPGVAAMHAGLTADQVKILLDIGKPVVWMFDNDEAGIKATKAAIKVIGNHLPMSVVEYPKRYTGTGRKQVCLKDPAECTRKELVAMVAGAKLV